MFDFRIAFVPFATDWPLFFNHMWTPTSIASVPRKHSTRMGHACLQVPKLFLPLDKVHIPMRMLYVCLVEKRYGPPFPSHRIRHICCIVHHVIPFLADRIRSTRTYPSTCVFPRPRLPFVVVFRGHRTRLSLPLRRFVHLRPPSYATLVELTIELRDRGRRRALVQFERSLRANDVANCDVASASRRRKATSKELGNVQKRGGDFSGSESRRWKAVSSKAGTGRIRRNGVVEGKGRIQSTEASRNTFHRSQLRF